MTDATSRGCSVYLVLPTLGLRPSLHTAVSSLAGHAMTVHVRAVTAEVDVKSVVERLYDGTYDVGPDSCHADAILSAWANSSAEWCTWLNDDDFALPALGRALTKLASYQPCREPLVVFGDYLFLSGEEVRYIKTPRRLKFRHLAYGRDYVPGVLPFLNRAAVELIASTSTSTRDSFDYEWWLALGNAGARFRHIGFAYAAFVQHAKGRTTADPSVGLAESAALRRRYMEPVVARSHMLTTLTSLLARASAKRSSV